VDNPYPYVFNNYTYFDKYSRKVNKNDPSILLPQSTRTNNLTWFIYSCDPNNCDSNILGINNGDTPPDPIASPTLLQNIPNFNSDSPTPFYPNFYNDQTTTVLKY
jgi:hypothetical protein